MIWQRCRCAQQVWRTRHTPSSSLFFCWCSLSVSLKPHMVVSHTILCYNLKFSCCHLMILIDRCTSENSTLYTCHEQILCRSIFCPPVKFEAAIVAVAIALLELYIIITSQPTKHLSLLLAVTLYIDPQPVPESFRRLQYHIWQYGKLHGRTPRAKTHWHSKTSLVERLYIFYFWFSANFRVSH